jgi:hypothetical protein
MNMALLIGRFEQPWPKGLMYLESRIHNISGDCLNVISHAHLHFAIRQTYTMSQEKDARIFAVLAPLAVPKKRTSRCNRMEKSDHCKRAENKDDRCYTGQHLAWLTIVGQT